MLVVVFRLRPLYLQARIPVPIAYEPGWASGPVWTVGEEKNQFPLPGFEYHNVQPTACTLHWLRLAQLTLLLLLLLLLLLAVQCSAVGRGRASRPDHGQQHCYHHAPTVKPEAATAVELLMMGVRTPETPWAARKRQVINLRNCCIWLFDLFELHKFKFSCWK